jgi:hypothetical protein
LKKFIESAARYRKNSAVMLVRSLPMQLGEPKLLDDQYGDPTMTILSCFQAATQQLVAEASPLLPLADREVPFRVQSPRSH